MTTDRLFGHAQGRWAWFLCALVLGLAVGSLIEWFRWGGQTFLIGAVVLGGLALTGVVQLTRHVKTDV